MDFINQILYPTEISKKDRGEVLTPFSLIKEMLNTLPKDVWNNPDLKWLDPASGIGNFQFVILKKLMDGIKDKIKDEEERRKHIIENMIYYAEYSSLNSLIYRKIIDPKNKYKLNIHTGDSLKMDTNKHFKVDKFDVVVGNPPYQKFQKTKGKRGGGDLLWNKFVLLSINDLLIKDGYLTFVHPPTWRRPATKKSKTYGLYKLLTYENTMLELKMFDSKKGLKIFNSGTKFDYYTVKKTNNINNFKTKIYNYDGKIENINISKYNFLPHSNIELITNLIDINEKNNTNEDKVLYSRSIFDPRKKYVSMEKSKTFKYPLIHATNKSGIRYAYSSVNDKKYLIVI